MVEQKGARKLSDIGNEEPGTAIVPPEDDPDSPPDPQGRRPILKPTPKPTKDSRVPDAALPDGKSNPDCSKFAKKTAVIALAIALGIVTVAAATCMVVLFTRQQTATTTGVASQPDRMANEKADALLVDLKDANSPKNMPGRIATDDASKVKNMPKEIASGKFYALWDCDVMDVGKDGKAHLLVTLREMYPVPGRIWTNWYNWTDWTGWKSAMPN